MKAAKAMEASDDAMQTVMVAQLQEKRITVVKSDGTLHGKGARKEPF